MSLFETGAYIWIGSWVVGMMSVPSVLTRRSGHPMSALSWLFALFVMPPFALIFWWLFGRRRLHMKRQRRLRRNIEIQSRIAQTVQRQPQPAQPHHKLQVSQHLPEDLHSQLFPPSAGNTLTLLINAQIAYPAFEKAIHEAQHHIHALFYIWQDDEVGRKFRDLLVEKARQGVEVRVLYDSLGSNGLPRSFWKKLKEAGGQARAFLPVRFFTRVPTLNFRNHRKILITDAKVGFIGGINLGEEYLQWHDIAMRMRGPTIDQLQEVFAEDWYFAAKEDLSEGDYFGRWVLDKDENEEAWADEQAQNVSCSTIASGPIQRVNSTHELLFASINNAKTRVWMMTPYFVPSSTILAALRSAAYRGVDVRLMLPEHNDVKLVRWASRAYYNELLISGIRVYEYDGMLHAKVNIFDDDTVFVGSANLDTRSFRHNFEAGTLVHSPVINLALSTLYIENIERCCLNITPKYMERHPYIYKLLDSVAHLASPML